MSEVEWTRLFLILVIQSLISIFFFVTAFKIVKRNRNRSTLTLSTFYVLSGCGFIVNLILLPININPASFILYIISFFLISFGQIFLVIFLKNLLKIEQDAQLKTDFIIVLVFALLLLLLPTLTRGITFNEQTNWSPVFSWPFLILLYMLLTLMIFGPSISFLKKLYNRFENEDLKKKLRFFMIGCYGMMFSLYGAILYNTWQNPIYKIIWSFLVLIIVPSGFLIYYGIAHDL